jgi:hemoglobin
VAGGVHVVNAVVDSFHDIGTNRIRHDTETISDMSEMSLYARLGGEEALEAVVDDFYDRVLADEGLRPYFEDVSMDELRDHQKQFLSAVTGGPVEWEGQDMDRAHAHLDITSEDFAAVAEHLQATLVALDVPEEERTAVMETVAMLEPSIVSA